jgi:hypothetical protein
VVEEINRVDQRLVRRSVAIPSARPDSGLKGLTRAAAAAFVIAATMESPALGLAVAPVAVAVAYSRVHTACTIPPT